LAIVLASVIIGVRPLIRPVVRTIAAGSAATLLIVIIGLYRDFPAFGILGGMVVSAVATAVYVLGTSRAEETWRDANLR
jgi:hypothetical protein